MWDPHRVFNYPMSLQEVVGGWIQVVLLSLQSLQFEEEEVRLFHMSQSSLKFGISKRWLGTKTLSFIFEGKIYFWQVNSIFILLLSYVFTKMDVFLNWNLKVKKDLVVLGIYNLKKR